MKLLSKVEKHSLFPVFIYLSALFIVLIATNYFQYLLAPAGGIHYWRQSDSGSFVAYYYEHGMNFFNTGTYNAGSNEGRAISEFPILYYITAALWVVFGRSDITLKIITSLIFFIGFYYVFKLSIKITGRIYLSATITTLLLSSPTLLCYSNSFIPDPSALGLSLIGIYLFYTFYETGKYSNYLWAWFFFILASLIKITVAIFPITFFCLFIIERFFKISFSNKTIFNGNILRYIIPFVLLIAATSGWVIWVNYYNHLNNSGIFLTTYRPIWDYTTQEIIEINNGIHTVWYPYYYYFTTTHIFFLLIFCGILFLKKWDTISKWMLLFFWLGSISYVLLFYRQFGYHDYYILPLIATLSFSIIHAINSIIKQFSQYARYVIPGLTTGLLVLNVLSYIYTHKKIAQHNKRDNYSYLYQHPAEFSGKMEQLGLPQNAIVFSFPDPTPNGTLYYMQRRGYTNWGNPNIDFIPELLKEHISKGANYLVISAPEYYKFAKSDWFTTQLVSNHPYVKVFKITSVDTSKLNGTQ